MLPARLGVPSCAKLRLTVDELPNNNPTRPLHRMPSSGMLSLQMLAEVTVASPDMPTSPFVLGAMLKLLKAVPTGAVMSLALCTVFARKLAEACGAVACKVTVVLETPVKPKTS